MKLEKLTIAVSVIMGLCGIATAEITFTSPTMVYAVANPDGIMTPMTGGEPVGLDTTDGMRLVGDVNLDLSELTPDDYPSLSISARRTFTIGEIPMEVWGEYSANFKLVNSLGGRYSPTTTVGCVFSVWDVATDSMLSLANSTGTILSGNGYEILDDTGGDLHGSWILSPNREYEMRIDLMGEIDVTNPDPYPMPYVAGVTLEFGAVTAESFSGFEMSIFGTPIPEPATLSLLALGGMAMLRRRVGRER